MLEVLYFKCKDLMLKFGLYAVFSILLMRRNDIVV